MNTPTTNPTTSSNRWAYFSRMIRGFLGVPLSAVLTAALLFVGIMAGCKEDEGTVVGVFDNTPPLAGAVVPTCSATGVALNQKISATFNEAMDPSTVTAATFTLSGPSGSPVSGTVAYVSATNIATFTPASNLTAGTTYTWTIKGGSDGAKDLGGNSLSNNFGCSFTTAAAAPVGDVTPPTVVSTNPANNATGVSLSKVSSKGSARSATVAKLNKTTGVASGKIITATFSEAMDPLTITSLTFTVTGPGGTPVVGFVTYAGPTFGASFIAATNLAPSTTYTGTITTGAKDVAGNALASNYVWSFNTGATPDITSPTVISTDPVNNATGVALNKKIAATFSEAMNGSTINATTITLKQGTTSVLGAVTYTGATALFTPASTLAANTVYTATIGTGVTDTAGNALASGYIWNFTTGAAADVTPPTVISTDPANNATAVAVNKIITATFSEAMDPSTLGTATFTLRQGTTVIPGTLTYAGTTENFTPASNLAANTVYTATMSTGVKDLAGNALASNYVWSFTTAATADVLPPSVLSTDPANNAAGVAVNKIVTAIFNEAMDQSTISTATVTVTGLGGVPVTGTVSYASAANTVTFTPAVNLGANTTYTGTIKGGPTGAKDLAGNALANNYLWNFTTAPTLDVTLPTVVFTDPVNNATGVALNKKIAATFSEAMDQSTMNATTITLKQGTTSVLGAVTYSGTTALFTPSSSLAPSTVYTATISTGAKDLAGNALAGSYVWNFTTGAAPDLTPPTVIATDPVNNATGVALSKVNAKGSARNAAVAAVNKASGAAAGKIITATFSEAMDPLTITSSTFLVTGPGVTPVTGLLVAYTGTSFTATFISANRLAPNTTYTGTITTGAKDLAGNAMVNNYVWNFTTGAAPDTVLPTVISTDPDNGALGVALNKKITATFSKVMNPLSVNTTTFTLQVGTLLVPGTVSYTGTTALFAPTGNLAPNTVYTATMDISARDLAGNNLAGNYVWNFTTGAAPDLTPPTVILTDPLNNATGVALNKKIAATFSEAMDPLTVSTSTFTLKQGTTSILGTLNYLGAIAVFTPTSNLAPSTVYTATVSTGAKDLAGNALASNYVWNFTTGAAPDLTPPTVTSTDPANNATGVPLTKIIAAFFNEAMDPSSITTASVSVTGLGGSPVVGTVNYSAITNSLTFTPSTSLAPNTTFSATIKGGVSGAKDLAGNALASNYVWKFTTGAALDVTPPIVVLTDPDCGSGGVSTNKKIAVTFSEAMNPATINTSTFTVTGPGPGVTPVTGTVTYDTTSHIALFATTNFAFLSTYTYTIHSGATGVKDLAGNALVSDFVCSFTTGSGVDNTNPSVTSTDPLNNATGVALNKVITASFSKTMDPTTINVPGTFTLKQGLNPVTGTVSYLGSTASFTPGSNLLGNTIYTATITTAAKDLAGNAIANNYVWSFTTSASGHAGPASVNLGSAGNFAVLAGAAVSNTGVTTHIYGDVGSFPTPTINGLLAGNVTGILYVIADPIVGLAKVDLTTAYNDAQGRSLNAISLPGQIGGLTLAPGLYVNSTTSGISGTGPNGILTLDAGGDANAVWIFKVGSTFITDAGTSVVLAGGAQWQNIYWSVGTSATLGTNSTFYGNILADQAITLTTGATLRGRALTRIAAVTLDSNIIDKR